MPSIEKRVRNGQKIWRAHYRTPAGAQRNKSFARKIDAERFLATVESAKLTGTYVDPQLAKVTVGDVGRPVAGRPSPPQTFHPPALRRDHPQTNPPEVGLGHARRRLARRRPGLDYHAVHEPVARQRGQDPPSAQHGPGHGSQGRPAVAQRGHRREPPPRRQARTPLPDPRPGRRPRPCVWLPSQTRQARQLRHPHQRDVPASGPLPRLHRCPVRRDGRPSRQPDRPHQTPCRDRRLRDSGPRARPGLGNPEDTPTSRGPHSRSSSSPNCGHTLRASDRTTSCSPGSAVVRLYGSAPSVSPSTRPHELSACPGSIPTSSGTPPPAWPSPSGADVKVVQQMLGHASATMTLDTYGHLFEDRLDEVGDAMDAARSAAQKRRATLHVVPCCCPSVAPGRIGPRWPEGPEQRFRRSGPAFRPCTPNGIRTRATAVKGRRPRPLDDGGRRA